MKLIIIGGPSCTGKSTLARKLSTDLEIPAFLIDDEKEKHYRAVGKKPNVWHVGKIDIEAYHVMYDAVAKAVERDTDLIIEANFFYSARRKIQKLIKPETQVIELFCRANGFTVFKRYVHRNETGGRHAGHRDRLWYPLVFFEALGIGRHYRPLKLSDRLLIIDANDFENIDYSVIRKFVNKEN